MLIVESQFELNILSTHITTEHVFMDAVMCDGEKHPSNNQLSLLFFYFLTSKTVCCLPIKHNETINHQAFLGKVKDDLRLSIYNKMVVDKKSMIQLLGSDYDFVDLSVYNFLDAGMIEAETPTTNAHTFINCNFRNIPDLNVCTPLYKHAKVFTQLVERYKNVDLSNIRDRGFLFTNNTMIGLFAKLENNGIAIDVDKFTEIFGDEQLKHIQKNLVFSQYNLLTSTGRPSNRFGGVNYAALNKNDGSRDCFVSRYGDDGMLVMMDYNAFHPRLIAHLSNFFMAGQENPYSYLAKYFFNKTDVDEEDIAVAKGFTFMQIYGGIDKKWCHIPYLNKVQEYIDHRWKFFLDNGFIETPKYGRKIKACHIQDPTPNKLFNYILQAFETEMAVEVLGELTTFLTGMKTLPILYTYDSILFDAHRENKIDVIKRVKHIMERDKFPVKVYAGRTYGDMKQITL